MVILYSVSLASSDHCAGLIIYTMKKLFSFLCLIVLLLASAFSYAQCPPQGSESANSKLGRINIMKNRSVTPPGRHTPLPMRLIDILGDFEGQDSSRFHNGTYATTTGYITSYEERGPESCNCDEGSKSAHTGDVHIYIGSSPVAPKRECMLVEITPAFKQLHPDYSDKLIKGNQVKVTGFLLYDFEHKGNSANTCTSCKLVWRKTCWEIHPVTDFTVL